MYTLSLGLQTYKIEFFKGSRHITTIVRPLPPKNEAGRVIWQAEHLALHKEIKAATERLGVPYDYDPFFTLPKLTPQRQVVYLVANYHPYITSLPFSAHEDRQKSQMASRWGHRQFLSESKGVPMSRWPNRLANLGTIPFSQIAEAQYVYSRLLCDNPKPLRVYQCTCGRVLAVPSNEDKPNRDFGSCGCLAGVYASMGTRDSRKRRLDAFREWTTMVMACYDKRSVYYDPNNVFNLHSFPEFFKWYTKQVKNAPLTHRFVARKDPTQPFEIKNLKIVDKGVDIVPMYGYTIL